MAYPRARRSATSSALRPAMPVRTGGIGLNHANLVLVSGV
jgi:hypothetical protein